MTETFLKEMSGLINMDLYPAVSRELHSIMANGIIKSLEDYILCMTQVSEISQKDTRLSDTQLLSVMCNAFYIADDLVPRIKNKFEEIYASECFDIEEFVAKAQRYFHAQRDHFCQINAPSWLKRYLDWTNAASQRYNVSDSGFVLEKAMPMPGFVDLVNYFGWLKNQLELSIHKEVARKVVSHGLLEVLLLLCSEKAWKHCPSVSRSGVDLFALDIKFLMTACEGFIHDQAPNSAQDCIARCTAQYVASQSLATKSDAKSISASFSLRLDKDYQTLVSSFIASRSIKLLSSYVLEQKEDPKTSHEVDRSWVLDTSTPSRTAASLRGFVSIETTTNYAVDLKSDGRDD
jgi:hypothetical protein